MSWLKLSCSRSTKLWVESISYDYDAVLLGVGSKGGLWTCGLKCRSVGLRAKGLGI